MNYTVKIWHSEFHKEWRYNVPWAFALALATRGGFEKCQIICEMDIIQLETKGETL